MSCTQLYILCNTNYPDNLYACLYLSQELFFLNSDAREANLVEINIFFTIFDWFPLTLIIYNDFG